MTTMPTSPPATIPTTVPAAGPSEPPDDAAVDELLKLAEDCEIVTIFVT